MVVVLCLVKLVEHFKGTRGNTSQEGRWVSGTVDDETSDRDLKTEKI